MKRLTALFIGIGCLGFGPLFAGETPSGDLLELHSCELYAGGCVVSSEATMGGRYMLRAWNFTGGTFRNVRLAGLKLAALQVSSENLATEKANPGRVVVYLPADASAEQRRALLAWFTSSQLGNSAARVQTRSVPLQFALDETDCRVNAGEFMTIQANPMGHCGTWSCGESLWYTPRSVTTAFSVAVDKESRIDEPLLKLKWEDGGKRNVFLGRFGANASSAIHYVASAEMFAACH